MRQAPATRPGAVQQTLDREVDLVISALNLVASGAAPSATVGGLRLGDAVLVIAQPAADERGVVLEALWHADEDGCDIHVRRA